MITIEYEKIDQVITRFYQLARTDILIGYHFRHIADFDQHIPRICKFWQLHLTGKIDDPSALPFDLFGVHRALKIKRGEIDRWVMLFNENLSVMFSNQVITMDQYQYWKNKIENFQAKFILEFAPDKP